MNIVKLMGVIAYIAALSFPLLDGKCESTGTLLGTAYDVLESINKKEYLDIPNGVVKEFRFSGYEDLEGRVSGLLESEGSEEVIANELVELYIAAEVHRSLFQDYFRQYVRISEEHDVADEVARFVYRNVDLRASNPTALLINRSTLSPGVYPDLLEFINATLRFEEPFKVGEHGVHRDVSTLPSAIIMKSGAFDPIDVFDGNVELNEEEEMILKEQMEAMETIIRTTIVARRLLKEAVEDGKSLEESTMKK